MSAKLSLVSGSKSVYSEYFASSDCISLVSGSQVCSFDFMFFDCHFHFRCQVSHFLLVFIEVMFPNLRVLLSVFERLHPSLGPASFLWRKVDFC